LSDENDNHRTGCGCVECGPNRRDPVTFDYVDPELRDARLKLSRIEALVVNYERCDPYNGVATLRKIREVIDG
jgi:hypothetical protein